MKKNLVYSLVILGCLSLTACGINNQKQASDQSEASSLKKDNSRLKAKIKEKEQKNTRSSSSASSQLDKQQVKTSNSSQQISQSSNAKQVTPSNGISNADEAVNAAQVKYGTDNGDVHWIYMTDGYTGKPIVNDDGSYFVKGVDNQTMSGTRYSVRVYPDGSITSN